MLCIYGDILSDQEKLRLAEKVNTTETQSQVHYIQHHAAKKDSLTTPICIVYNCSCQESSVKPSLNDCLMSVLPMLNNLTRIIARSRVNP